MNRRPPAAIAPNVRVHIERLVLEDWPEALDGARRARLEAAVSAAIAGRLASGGLAAGLAGGGALAALPGGTVRIPSHAAPNALGAAIGAATAGPLARPANPAP